MLAVVILAFKPLNTIFINKQKTISYETKIPFSNVCHRFVYETGDTDLPGRFERAG
jgi:hypothetical protein